MSGGLFCCQTGGEMTHIGKEQVNSFARWPGRFAVTALMYALLPAGLWSRSLLKKVLEGSRCAMLIQNSSGRCTKDSHRRHFVFGYCASSTRLRVFQQTVRSCAI